MRRLSIVNEFRIEYFEVLLDWWEQVDNDTADPIVRDRVSQVEALLNSYQNFPFDVPPPTE